VRRFNDILKTGFGSPVFQGEFMELGRYCPSIEDKINRFAEEKGTNCCRAKVGTVGYVMVFLFLA
jgi:tRNA U34 5-carboxymethylaminomethyl modifying enzyme MnmG/GidA